MKKILFIFAVCMMIQGLSFAALPPLWQNVAEIKAILNDPKLGTLLSSAEVIEDIKKTNNGWTIITNRQELPIQIVYQPSTTPGPAHFRVQFETPTQK